MIFKPFLTSEDISSLQIQEATVIQKQKTHARTNRSYL